MQTRLGAGFLFSGVNISHPRQLNSPVKKPLFSLPSHGSMAFQQAAELAQKQGFRACPAAAVSLLSQPPFF